MAGTSAAWTPERRAAQAQRLKGNKLALLRHSYGWDDPARKTAHADRMRGPTGQAKAMVRARDLEDRLAGYGHRRRMAKVGSSGWTFARRAEQASRLAKVRPIPNARVS